MARGTEIYIDEIRVLGETIRDAIRSNDIIILRGIQAMESTIWNKVRASESIISTIIGNSADKLDLSNPEKDKASKIRTHIMNEWRNKWRGVSAENILATLEELERLELIDIFTRTYINRQGKEETVIKEVSLKPIWDDVIEEMIISGSDRYIFASSIGKLIGLSIAGNIPDRRGRRAWGVGSWRPVSVATRSADPDGRISKKELEEVFIQSTHDGKRKFYEMRERDKAKAEEIRFMKDDGAYVIINRNAILAYERILENARRLTMERFRE
ncbi:MAG: hypothetical protein KAU14_07470 [Thermoplasmata archaeon]|nr:hypothetical protein [Thermoplasmata archaeon]